MQVGEIRPATVDDFKQLLDIVSSHDGWEDKPNKGGVKVWTKSISNSPVKMIKLAVDLDDVSALTLYDVLHDPTFRSVWDESMIEGLDIYKIDDFNDIGYYSLRCPPPLKNRDFVNQRSWGIFGDDHMIMNHTIDIEEMPVKKDFVRGVSYLTGYVVRSKEVGCSVYYITQNDPGGQVPKWILNRISSVIAPKVLEKIHKAALIYEDWKADNEPDWKPWRGIGTDKKLMWPKYVNNTDNCKASNSTPTLETVPDTTTPVPGVSNGHKDSEAQYGSLDSLAQHHNPDPEQEIIGNVFNVAAPEEGAPTRAPLLRHESITISCTNETPEDSKRSISNEDETSLSNDNPGSASAVSPQMMLPLNNHHDNYPVTSSRDNVTSSRGYVTSQAGYIMNRTDSIINRTDSMMNRTDSMDTAGSQISDLCHSLSQLTKGDDRNGEPADPPYRPPSAASSTTRTAAPPGAFASIAITTHPIDPDCGTRVSRHVMGMYGRKSGAKAGPPKSRSVKKGGKAGDHRMKKPVKVQPEGLESSSLKFFSKISGSVQGQVSTSDKRKKRHQMTKLKEIGEVEQSRRRTENR